MPDFTPVPLSFVLRVPLAYMGTHDSRCDGRPVSTIVARARNWHQVRAGRIGTVCNYAQGT